MDHRLPATREMAQEFSELFVNRRAYTIQSMRPHPESGRHYYYRPKTAGWRRAGGAHHRNRKAALGRGVDDRHLCHQPGYAEV